MGQQSNFILTTVDTTKTTWYNLDMAKAQHLQRLHGQTCLFPLSTTYTHLLLLFCAKYHGNRNLRINHSFCLQWDSDCLWTKIFFVYILLKTCISLLHCKETCYLLDQSLLGKHISFRASIDVLIHTYCL